VPVTRKEDAKSGGWKQVRDAIQVFEGDVIKAEFGQWGGALVDATGKPVPPKEFLEIGCINVKIVQTSEEPNFVPTEFNFRINCSDYKGSFWIEDFLESADKFKLLIPDGLMSKRVRWKKAVREYNIEGEKVATSGFIIDGIIEGGERPAPVAPSPSSNSDPMEELLELAVGKTEQQFRSAVALNPKFANSPLLSLVKAGAITSSFVEEGKLKLVKDGSREVYQK